MKISYNWLKDYIPVDLPAEEVAATLTDIGLEVEELIPFNGPGNGLKGLVVGLVKEAVKHPDADRLRVTKVDVGTGEDLQIVCGAPNVAQGQKVVVATVGTTLYPLAGEPFKITKAKIRGVESMGMICAEDEIGIGESHAGIIVLPDGTPVGQKVSEVYGVKEDVVFEIGLTPNRADAMGHIGVARDLRAALVARNGASIEFNLPKTQLPNLPASKKTITVKVENETACPRYTGIVLEGLEVKESPEWLQNRLRAVGMRPINNVVDITNYILAEYGQPLHAFDLDTLSGDTIYVKNLPEGSLFTTLDGTERKLNKDDLMICDAKGGLCIAGVFGGLHSGVTDKTVNVFIECAHFDAITIRKTAGRHNLRTDSAQKFEKGTDPNHNVKVLERTVGLLLDLAGGNALSKVVDVYPKPVADFPVTLSYQQVNTLIGHPIEKDKVKQIVQLVGIGIDSDNDDTLQLSVPPFKVDVKRPADVIEEILRIYGFNNIPFPDFLRSSLSFTNRPDKEKINNTVSTLLAGEGFFEIFNNSITRTEFAREEEGAVRLLNSLNAGLDSMRTSMLYSGLECISYNLNRKNSDLKFFEIGKTYHTDGDGFREVEHLSLFVTGFAQGESWLAPKRKPADYYLLKPVVESILTKLGVTKTDIAETTHVDLEFGLDYLKNGKRLATFGKVNKSALKQTDIKQDVYFADLDWTVLVAEADKIQVQYKAVSKFPTMRRDLALLLDKSVEYADIEKIAWNEAKKHLKAVHLFDKYEDSKLGEGKKSYAVSYLFEDDQRTLTDTEVDKIMEKLINRYRETLKAEIRQ